MLRLLTFFFLFIQLNAVLSQVKDGDHSPIQFTGKVVTADENGDVIPLPYTSIYVKGTTRGATADYEGYFSFVALKGETIEFSRLGFRDVEFTIPDTMKSSFYSWIQIMTENNFLLPQVVIFAWPSKEHFKQEFLAIDISNELREHANENLAQQVMKDIRYTVPADGKESSSIYMRQQAEEYKYSGQIKPQKIFDVMAWKRFIEAWKRGDFKSKKKE